MTSSQELLEELFGAVDDSPGTEDRRRDRGRRDRDASSRPSEPRPPATRRARRAVQTSSSRVTVVALIIALLGVSIMLYPSAASWFSELQQRGALSGYTEQVQGTDPAVLAQRLDAARAYNAALDGGALLDPFTNPSAVSYDDAARDYLAQLTAEPDDVIAELRIPGVSAVLPVYHGTSAETLARGIGHLYGSSLPVGGESTHAVLTGHRGYPEATLFSDLDKMTVGETFTVTTLGEVLSYRVTSIEVVEPADTASLAIVPGKDLVTLITCTPLGVNSHRLLVHAERTAAPGDAAAADIPLSFPWWMVILSAAVGVGVTAILWRRRRLRSRLG